MEKLAVPLGFSTAFTILPPPPTTLRVHIHLTETVTILLPKQHLLGSFTL